MQPSPDATDRQPDEVLLHQGMIGDETVLVFLTHAADCLNHWRVRAVFCDPTGEALDEKVLHLPRSKRLTFRITRFGKPDFTYPVPRDGSATATAPSLFNTRRHP